MSASSWLTVGSTNSADGPDSGKSGAYYGCLAAAKGACKNKTLVRRTPAERVILEAVTEATSEPEHIQHVLQRVEDEIDRLRSDLPDTLKLKEAELAAEQRRMPSSSTSSAKAAAPRRSPRRWSRPSAA